MMKDSNQPTLWVITGPTAVGKTEYAIRMAQQHNSCIISVDSRQFYKEMKIGTASPTPEELAAVPHYFVGTLSIHDYYNVSQFEEQVLALLENLFRKHQVVIMTGGSGLYIDAVCRGVDAMPDPDLEVRQRVMRLLEEEGIEALRAQLRLLDPTYCADADMANHKHLVRALEVCLQTGQPYSSFRTGNRKPRPFAIVKQALERPREELFDRINRRVDVMMEQGLLEEARGLYPYKHLNALNTVGYKELFDFFEGKLTLERAIEDIKTHTRRYAKRQMTWFKRDGEYEFVTQF